MLILIERILSSLAVALSGVSLLYPLHIFVLSPFFGEEIGTYIYIFIFICAVMFFFFLILTGGIDDIDFNYENLENKTRVILFFRLTFLIILFILCLVISYNLYIDEIIGNNSVHVFFLLLSLAFFCVLGFGFMIIDFLFKSDIFISYSQNDDIQHEDTPHHKRANKPKTDLDQKIKNQDKTIAELEKKLEKEQRISELETQLIAEERMRKQRDKIMNMD